ncbi:uncharacterized protein K444DRAFT_646398 [Hyaloscypha bicolor E]|uniref:Cenp-O kinetochore centromere component n=1 Tax=Hyaloscypha bicolor E TaxID=1095630 RepID=A0A2J6STF6_9HELO|nr:uncharacterized protein K444DRAFT_646398 [Hyaloscypha bicolor E]PMD54032.1 hypothetical protein K444DRAFT_646398 [Hyaloscypha bicolor E]
MIPSVDDSIPEDPIDFQLDNEISDLQDQISALKAQRSIQVSTILSSQSTRSTLNRLRVSQKQSKLSPTTTDTTPLLSTSTAQLVHTRENLYRLCAGITTFRIQDPDPNAVDDGKVLGLRIDVASTGKFVRPYYVMLNKPFAGSELLRVHRHTIPPCIPLSLLVDRYLPNGKGSAAMGSKEPGAKKQDLRRFARALRKEIVGYHNRVSVIKGLRKEFKLDEKVSRKGKGRERVIADISAADAEAKQVRIEWVDGRIGRCVVGDGGEVRKCVVIGEEGRDFETERRVARGAMEGIGERLREGIY